MAVENQGFSEPKRDGVWSRQPTMKKSIHQDLPAFFNVYIAKIHHKWGNFRGSLSRDLPYRFGSCQTGRVTIMKASCTASGSKCTRSWSKDCCTSFRRALVSGEYEAMFKNGKSSTFKTVTFHVQTKKKNIPGSLVATKSFTELIWIPCQPCQLILCLMIKPPSKKTWALRDAHNFVTQYFLPVDSSEKPSSICQTMSWWLKNYDST